MTTILEKTKNGWECIVKGCPRRNETFYSWRDAEIHASDHGVPQESVATLSQDGRIVDLRGTDPDTLRLAGLL